jgi:gluconolactonase
MISNRSLIAISLALVGTTIVTSTVRSAEPKVSPADRHIDRLDPALDKLIDTGAKIEVIAEGLTWCEGPAWVREGNFLLFSDIPNNAIMRWDAEKGSRLYLKPAGYTGDNPRGGESGSNGLTTDNVGNLILCQHGDRRIARLNSDVNDPKPKYITLADSYQGKRLNSPNDLIVDSRDGIFFTDPAYGLEKGMEDPKKELPFQGVYRINSAGDIKLLTKDIERPNGIALSPDEKTLYVANSHGERPVILAFELKEDTTLANEREFYNARKSSSKEPGACDGLKVDKDGNVWATIPGGVGIFSPDGKQLGLIATGDRTANVEFGGDDGSTLFICANHNVLKVPTKTKGLGF